MFEQLLGQDVSKRNFQELCKVFPYDAVCFHGGQLSDLQSIRDHGLDPSICRPDKNLVYYTWSPVRTVSLAGGGCEPDYNQFMHTTWEAAMWGVARPGRTKNCTGLLICFGLDAADISPVNGLEKYGTLATIPPEKFLLTTAYKQGDAKGLGDFVVSELLRKSRRISK